MLREVARDVRRIQQANITAQRAPDGTAWEPRRVTARTKPGRIRSKMFIKIKTVKFLKVKSDIRSADVYFIRSTQRLAQVHHYGLREKINAHGPGVKYKQRQLLGFDVKIEENISEKIVRWIMKC